MLKVIKPKKSGFQLHYYCGFCLFIVGLISIQVFRLLKVQSPLISLILATLVGASLGLILFAPIIRNIHLINKSINNFLSLKKNFSARVKFPLELALLSEEIKELCTSTLKSNQELSRQDTARRELLANAAHDIKGPLSAISGYIEDSINKLRAGDIETAKQSLDICHKNSLLLEGIVLQIFEAAKFDNLSGNLALEVISIDELISDIAQKFQARASKELKHIIFKPGSNNSLLQIDLGLLERAISNLIDNALKYTIAEGQISIGSKLEGDLLLIYISDNGKGIPEKDLPHIFDRLYRVERDRSKEAKGSGFGLSIVKKIIEAHHGQIMCSSTIGAGTTFQITLPILPKEQIARAMAELISKRN